MKSKSLIFCVILLIYAQGLFAQKVVIVGRMFQSDLAKVEAIRAALDANFKKCEPEFFDNDLTNSLAGCKKSRWNKDGLENCDIFSLYNNNVNALTPITNMDNGNINYLKSSLRTQHSGKMKNFRLIELDGRKDHSTFSSLVSYSITSLSRAKSKPGDVVFFVSFQNLTPEISLQQEGDTILSTNEAITLTLNGEVSGFANRVKIYLNGKLTDQFDLNANSSRQTLTSWQKKVVFTDVKFDLNEIRIVAESDMFGTSSHEQLAYIRRPKPLPTPISITLHQPDSFEVVAKCTGSDPYYRFKFEFTIVGDDLDESQVGFRILDEYGQAVIRDNSFIKEKPFPTLEELKKYDHYIFSSVEDPKGYRRDYCFYINSTDLKGSMFVDKCSIRDDVIFYWQLVDRRTNKYSRKVPFYFASFLEGHEDYCNCK